MKKTIPQKREYEKQVVAQMIALYCRNKHKHKNGLCDDCKELLEYAQMRSDKCPFMENKTFCSNCKVHCYKPGMREEIRKVMRYSGPMMLFYHPVTAIRHLVLTIKEKKSQKNQEKKNEG